MLDAIVASKMFQTSNRQAQIKTAAESPINQELVKQLTSYLDKSSVSELESTVKSDKDDQSSNTSAETPKEKKRQIIHKPHKSSSAAPHLSPASFTPSDSVDDAANTPEIDTDDSKLSNEPSSIDDSSKVVDDSSKAVDNSATVDNKTPISAVEDPDIVPGDLADIKTRLNDSDDVAGVSRIAVKQAKTSFEVWIYYRDDINLNNIMSEVIDNIINWGYDSLEFNRLARSENAIVFEIK